MRSLGAAEGLKASRGIATSVFLKRSCPFSGPLAAPSSPPPTIARNLIPQKSSPETVTTKAQRKTRNDSRATDVVTAADNPPHRTFRTRNKRMRLWLSVLLLSCVPLTAYAGSMVTSHYNAKAPYIAAHRTLPMGTRLNVRNPRNGRTAQVVIGDRGPFIHGRVLDIFQRRCEATGVWQ